MNMKDSRPWVLLDVDGVLNALAHNTDDYEHAYVRALDTLEGYEPQELVDKDYEWKSSEVVFSIAYRPEWGEKLMTLEGDYQLAWATTWKDAANSFISPLLGLPEDLPVVPFSHRALMGGFMGTLYSKTSSIVEWSREHCERFIWLDDNVGLEDIKYVKANTDGLSVARYVDPVPGLRDVDFEAVQDFINR